MKRRMLSWLLTGTLAASLLTGCGNGAGPEGSGASGGGTATQQSGEREVNGIDISETYDATMVLIGSQQADQQMVLDEINEILMRDINTRLNIVMLSMYRARGNLYQQ